ncbi:GNAT family N-acetyltransferase [Aurantimonas sp. VKM B-3413]|uniref:GNAT family N-acetyltransferase n=1 Tax=Aurantimonas sp. VKM B-3413 TaxID=2779401 RepID=UPI001E59EC19|nr:GNAT family N-acetyltransferase [Aurantimonas sp. VKM B-3413]MCB8837899.1 GNAT family N-acetyltransferase [Aurantimonas sp. VKM B-3413]
MSAAVTIRRVVAADEPEWRRLWNGYLTFYGTALDEAVYRSTFARLLGDAPYDPNCLLAIVEGKTVGLVHYLFHRHCWREENVCYLQDLYADPAVRGTGIGRRLIEAVYAASDAAGCPTVYWVTQEFNYQGRMLYDRIGTKTPFIKYQR